jgi:predicted nucleic acid-binding protein
MGGIDTLVNTNIIGTVLSDKKNFTANFSKIPVIDISIITKYEFLSNPDLTLKDKYLFEEYPDTIEVYGLLKTHKIIREHLISIRKKYKLKLPDAITTVTAMTNNATLICADNTFLKIHNLKFKLIKA